MQPVTPKRCPPTREMQEVRWVREPDLEAWGDLVSRCPSATFFHTPEWLHVCTASYAGRRWHLLVLPAEGGRWIAGMPLIEVRKVGTRHLFALPLGLPGQPISEDQAPETAEQAIWAALAQLAASGGWGLVQVTCPPLRPPPSPPAGFEVQTHTTHILDLREGAEAIWKNRMHRNVRHQTRQAVKRGLEVRPIADSSEVETCYNIMVETAIRHRAPASYPLALLQNIYDHLVPSGRCRWWGAYHEGRLVATLISFCHGHEVTLWASGSQTSSLALRPYNLLYWTNIAWAAQNGYRRLDWGASPPGRKGLVRFKERWGAVPVNYYGVQRVAAWLKPLMKLLPARLKTTRR